MRVILLFVLWTPLMRAQSLAIEHVTVIDATGKPAQPGMTVLIDRDRITSVGPPKSAKIPKGATIVEGRGKFLIPGLWDMHAHFSSGTRPTWAFPLFLANGVLGVRDMWGPEDANAWRAQQARNDKPSPSIYLASPIIDGPKPLWPGSIAVADEAQGRAAVDRYKDFGADFIKVYSLLPRDAYFAIADEARKRGISFVGHVPRSVRAAEASDAGQKSIEHLEGVSLGCSSEEPALLLQMQHAAPGAPAWFAIAERAIETYDEATAQSLFARFKKNGTWHCPTLTVIRAASHRNDPEFVKDERLKYMPRELRTSWNANDPRLKAMAADTRTATSLLARYAENLKLVGRMHRAGVEILAGTDTMNPFCFPGFSLHDELALLVEAGLSPMEALQASTKDAARFMGQLDSRGTIEAGKIADLVLLGRDPLADIHNTRSIQVVVLRGKLMRRSDLDAMLAEAEAAAAK